MRLLTTRPPHLGTAVRCLALEGSLERRAGRGVVLVFPEACQIQSGKGRLKRIFQAMCPAARLKRMVGLGVGIGGVAGMIGMAGDGVGVGVGGMAGAAGEAGEAGIGGGMADGAGMAGDVGTGMTVGGEAGGRGSL